MKKVCLTLLATLTIQYAWSQETKRNPSFEEVISLRGAGYVTISPNGELGAFVVQKTDWTDNRFDSEIWMIKNGAEPFAFTHNPNGNSVYPVFSPDNKWLAFLSDRGNKMQVFAMRVNGGEPIALTDEEEGVSTFEWHPDGKRILFLKQEKEPQENKKKQKRYGAFEVDDKEYNVQHLWEISLDFEGKEPSELPCYATSDSLRLAEKCITKPKAQRLTEGAFTINDFKISPDGKKVAFSHQPDPLINSFVKSDISMLDLNTKAVSVLVANPSSDSFEDWSPDSKSILYTSFVDDTVSNFYRNAQIFSIQIDGQNNKRLAERLDENPGMLQWNPRGIYGLFWNKTARDIYRIEPKDGSFSKILGMPEQVQAFAFSMNADKMLLNARNGNQLAEIWITPMQKPALRQVTSFTQQIADWKVAESELVMWRSEDGTLIEGVLHKPVDYDESKKYPLMVVIHGGPTGIDTPSPVPGYVYPIVQWLNKGCLVLRPNYRGSAGYGEAFRSLNVKNLGVGDAWDVISGVDYLIAKGMVDSTKIGVMGWSQGGYISAFLTTNSDKFKAVSVGAGISNWMTYYVNTDIHPFTRQYLKATPWDDEDIYRKTSPMTNIKKAKTPTLIQHGEFDRRVPIPNAYELLQGLRDQGVPAELIIYKGFGHGITKPKERLAATWHNWVWFAKYVWGEEVELPVGN